MNPQVRPHPEVGAVPVGRPGHVPGDAQAAVHEGAGAHRQVVRGLPTGAAVRGGGPETEAAVVRSAAQQELHQEHVTRERFPQRSVSPLKSEPTPNLPFFFYTKTHLCLDPNITDSFEWPLLRLKHFINDFETKKNKKKDLDEESTTCSM